MPTVDRLTKTIIDNAKTDGKDLLIWSRDPSGFGVRVKASGAKAFIVAYRNKFGQQRRYTIGKVGILTVDEARKQARLILADVARGDDPAEDRQAVREVPTVRDFSERYMRDHAARFKASSTFETDEINLRRHILPALGRRQVNDIKPVDVQKLHQQMADKPGAANRTLALLSHMMTMAMEWGCRPEGANPCSKVRPYKLKTHRRYLSSDELSRLGDALRQAEEEHTMLPSAVQAIRLLLLTGCRLGEVLSLKWSYVDFDNSWLNLPTSKTGPKIVHLNSAAVDVLRVCVGVDETLVLPGRKNGQPMSDLKRPWTRLQKAAGIEDVRIHDLRHSYGSIGAAMNLGAPILKEILGHTDIRTTSKYMHLGNDPIKAGNEAIGSLIASRLEGKE